MRVSEEKIQEVRERTDIVEVISQYVTLKKRGSSFVGLCPFHTEKTPSFHVDAAKGFYHCFGCGVGGNVFQFVMKMDNLPFPDAVRALADKAGIPLPESVPDSEDREIEMLYRVNKQAADFFKQCLFKTKAGEKALHYLQSRKFDQSVVEQFGLGYAPDRWDGVLRMADRESVDPKDLLKAGLVIPRKESGGYFDRFRGRLMFPFFNPSGRVVGFGGRILGNASNAPKYLNSPETPVYHKGKQLFGLFQSKSGIQREDRVLLVEGYTDVMRLHQSGLDFAVASSGTALTEDQAALIRRYTRRVTLVYDGDSAGFQAALRGVDILLGAGLKVEVVALPKGSDPDSFLRDSDVSGKDRLLGSAQSFVDFRLARDKESGRFRTVSDRADVTRQLLFTVAKVQDPLERNLMIKDISEKIGIPESLLVSELRSMQRKQTGTLEKTALVRESAAAQAEQGLVLLLLEDPSKWGPAVFPLCGPEAFRDQGLRAIAQAIHDRIEKGPVEDASFLLDRFGSDPDVSQTLAELLSRGIGKGSDRKRFGLDNLIAVRRLEIKEKLSDVRNRLRMAESKGEDTSELKQDYMDLKCRMEQTKTDLEEAWEKRMEELKIRPSRE